MAENWNSLDTKEKLNVVMADVCSLLMEIHTLLDEGGEFDSVVNDALESFGPLMKTLKITPKNLEDSKAEASKAEAGKAETSGVFELSMSDGLAHHTFRGDSSHEVVEEADNVDDPEPVTSQVQTKQESRGEKRKRTTRAKRK